MHDLLEKIRRSLSLQTLLVGLAFSLAGAAAISAGIVREQGYHSKHRGLSAWSVAPPNIGDQYHYLNIALALYKGKGYATDYTDPDFQRPLKAVQAAGYDGYEKMLRVKKAAAPTAYRLPAYPFMLSSLFHISGYNFVAPRILNCVLAGMVAAFVFLSADRLLSRKAAFVAVVILLFHVRMWVYTRLILTEIMAMAMAAGALYFLILAIQKKRVFHVFLCAIFVSIGILTRGALVFLIPFYSVALLLAKGQKLRKRALTIALFILICTLPLLPWVWRNNTIGGSGIGLCTQSGIDMPNGYTEVCLNSGGYWSRYSTQPYAAEMHAAFKEGGEWLACKKGREIFWRIIRENPQIIPKLVLVKLQKMLLPNPLQHPYFVYDLLLLTMAYAGFFTVRKDYLPLLLAQIMSVIACCVIFYADERYALPMVPALCILAASAFWWAGVKMKVFKPVPDASLSCCEPEVSAEYKI